MSYVDRMTNYFYNKKKELRRSYSKLQATLEAAPLTLSLCVFSRRCTFNIVNDDNETFVAGKPFKINVSVKVIRKAIR